MKTFLLSKKSKYDEINAVYECLGSAISARWSKFVLFRFPDLISCFICSPGNLSNYICIIYCLILWTLWYFQQSFPHLPFAFFMFHLFGHCDILNFLAFCNAGFLDFFRKMWKLKIASAQSFNPKQTAGKDFVYPPPPSFQETKAGNTKRRALRTTAYYFCTKVHTKYRPYSNEAIWCVLSWYHLYFFVECVISFSFCVEVSDIDIWLTIVEQMYQKKVLSVLPRIHFLFALLISTPWRWVSSFSFCFEDPAIYVQCP